MNFLEVKHLKMIQAIENTGNMTRAAERMFISQSALSQQLKDIETKLSATLFFRTPKKMILTKTGKTLLAAANQTIDILENTELEIAKMVAGEHGELKVGTQCIFCYKWLPSALSIFQGKFPNVDFRIGSSQNPIADLESGKFDLVITGAPDDKSGDNIKYAPLFNDQIICIMPLNHPLSDRSFVVPQDLREATIIFHTDKKDSKLYQLLLKPNGIEPKKYMFIGQPNAIIEMVENGFGIALFPKWAVSSFVEAKRISAAKITKKGVDTTWQAAYVESPSVPVFQSEFINIIKKLKVS